MQRRHIEASSGREFEDGKGCVYNQANGGECAYPFPELRPTNVGVWNLFHLCYAGTNHVGMDAVPVGRSPKDVESLARGLDVAWDQTTIEKFEIIQSAFLKKAYDERASDKARRANS